MKNTGLHLVQGKLLSWGTILVGFWAAWYVGTKIADDLYTNVLLEIGFLVSVIAVLTARRYWWVPSFAIGVFGLSTIAPGFKLDGADLMALFGFACLFPMVTTGKLSPKSTQTNLGLFFYLLLLYVGAHAVLYGVDNYYNGDTQLKNIVKRYYSLIASLIFIWCLDRYAHPKGLRQIINLMLLVSMFFCVVGVMLTIYDRTIPLLSEGVLNFAWADPDTMNGYLRGVPPVMMLLALCLTATNPKGWEKVLYRSAILLLIPATFFGGGRISLLVILLYLACWLIIRKKWKFVIFWGWLLALTVTGMAIAGRTMDAQQLQHMPKSFMMVQRAVSIFLPSDKVNDSEVETSGSDQWHQDLIQGAWDYANADHKTMIFGNGFKGWDDSIDMSLFTYGEAYESAVKIAIRMGASETMFFSILPILGWIGVVLYYGFIIELLRRNLRVRKQCPEGTLAKCLCEFAVCLLLTTLLLSLISGAIPSFGMIFWMIGFIAAEPYIQKEVKQQIAPREHAPPVFRGHLVKR